MSEFSSIGLNRPKDPANVGGVLRAAHVYGASMIAIAGDRSSKKLIRAGTNTTKAERRLPVIQCNNLRDVIPFGAIPIGVDLVDGAVDLCRFTHPKAAFYIFGPEDGTLDKEVLSWCAHKIMIPTSHCMNLAATVNVVLYDRMAKMRRA